MQYSPVNVQRKVMPAFPLYVKTRIWRVYRSVLTIWCSTIRQLKIWSLRNVTWVCPSKVDWRNRKFLIFSLSYVYRTTVRQIVLPNEVSNVNYRRYTNQRHRWAHILRNKWNAPRITCGWLLTNFILTHKNVTLSETVDACVQHIWCPLNFAFQFI